MLRKHLARTKNSVRRFRRLPIVIVAALAIFAIGAVTVLSRQPGKMKGSDDHERRLPLSDKTEKKYVTVKVAGQDVQVDGQTGQIQPLSPQDAEKLAAGLKQLINNSTEGLTEVHHEDGSVSVDLDGRFQNVTVARINKDGSVSQACVDNPQAAGTFFGVDPKLIEHRPNEK